MAYFMKNVEADYVFPMHMWQDYSAIEKYNEKWIFYIVYDNLLYKESWNDYEKK